MNLNDYCEQLKAGGSKVVVGSEQTLWVSHERFSMLRQPAFALHRPSREEMRDVFKRSHAAALTFITEPSETRAINSSLYLCTDKEYSLRKLGKGARYDTSRGLNEFEIRFMDHYEIRSLGEQAYRETFARVGLSANKRDPFEVRFRQPVSETCYLGALKGDRLAAFLLITEVDDWVAIAGYSANEFLPLRPNNALVYYALQHYIVERKFRVVSYGLSSLQAVSRAEGLHQFKLKMGFECIPVHRAITFNPLVRPVINRASWKLLNGLLKLSPRNPMLKKAEGALRVALEARN